MSKAYVYHVKNDCFLQGKSGQWPEDYKIAAVVRVGNRSGKEAADRAFFLTNHSSCDGSISPSQTLREGTSQQEVWAIGTPRSTVSGDIVMVPSGQGTYELLRYLDIGTEKVR